MKNIQPIGIFDSGVGGISVMSHIQCLLPNESLAYLADSLNAPYGIKSNEFITERSKAAINFLIKEQSAKLIVMACNTATASSINNLRQVFQVPIIGMEPAIKPATQATICKKVGVLATNGTLGSTKFSALLESYSGNIDFYTQPCPGLVELIEEGNINSSSTKNLIQKYLNPLIERKVATVVLGCTHYIFIRKLIENIMGSKVKIIDTGLAVAKQVKHELDRFSLQNKLNNKNHLIFTNSENLKMETIIRSLITNPNFEYSYQGHWK